MHARANLGQAIVSGTAAGLIPLGKTNVPEFGLLPLTEGKLYGPARNPHAPDYSPGGLAGSVAADVVRLAHCNDGGASIRIPASDCGLVGLKPTRARVTLASELDEAVDELGIDFVLTRTGAMRRRRSAPLTSFEAPLKLKHGRRRSDWHNLDRSGKRFDRCRLFQHARS